MSAWQHLQFIEPLLLAPGDRMSRDEFLRRWEQMPDLKFAELIEGVVYMPSPVTLPHASFDSLLDGLLFLYAARVPGCSSESNATWLMTPESAPQPDLSLHWVQKKGGRSWMEGRLAAGVPELAIEICASSRSYGLGPKLALCQAAGVPEYMAVLIEERRVEWRYLDQGRYRLLKAHKDGTLRSRIFPGLWLDAAAFWKADRAQMIAALERGLAERAAR